MKFSADLSVCLLPTNRPEMIHRCLESVDEFAGSVSCEIILVVSKSDDWLAEITAGFPETIIYDHNGPLGEIEARNHALRLAGGRYIMLCDARIVFPPQAIINLINFMDENPEIGLVGPQIINQAGEIQPSSGAFPSFGKLIASRSLMNDRRIKPAQSLAAQKVDWVDLSAMLIRRELLAEIGLLDENYAGPLGDLDYCLQADREGWHVCSLPGISLTISGQDKYRTRQKLHLTDIFRFFLKKWFS
ncbi:MAG: glycosyltransferase [Proteobacteria bacterium]|nr:glycosyltransferase [Pseudomonadota bacterium]MBU1715515.1 glycosyltransferase [Pseudomonadota bacterium]